MRMRCWCGGNVILVPRASVSFGHVVGETEGSGGSNYRMSANLGHPVTYHSRPQSLRSFWPAAGIESSGSNHYERTKEITEFWLSGSLRICIYGACLKWLLPELSIPAAGQKDRRLWGREW